MHTHDGRVTFVCSFKYIVLRSLHRGRQQKTFLPSTYILHRKEDLRASSSRCRSSLCPRACLERHALPPLQAVERNADVRVDLVDRLARVDLLMLREAKPVVWSVGYLA